MGCTRSGRVPSCRLNTHLQPDGVPTLSLIPVPGWVIVSCRCGVWRSAFTKLLHCSDGGRSRENNSYELIDSVLDGMPTEPIADECEGGALLYSSGTTGKPKGIRRPLSFAPMGEGAGVLTAFFAWCGFVDGSVYLSPAPLYHAAPIVLVDGDPASAGTVVLMERFDAEQALAAHRALQHHVRPVRPHHVRAHAQAAEGHAASRTTCRACGRSSTPPRRAPST